MRHIIKLIRRRRVAKGRVEPLEMRIIKRRVEARQRLRRHVAWSEGGAGGRHSRLGVEWRPWSEGCERSARRAGDCVPTASAPAAR